MAPCNVTAQLYSHIAVDNLLFCSFENNARLGSFTTALEFLDDVCSTSLVTKGFVCCVVSIKSIQRFVLVVMKDILCYAHSTE